MNWMRLKLRPHVGHHIVCVYYGDPDEPADICIECETCGCVLVSAEDFDDLEEHYEFGNDIPNRQRADQQE